IVLRMWRGKVSAAKVIVVFLFAMIGQSTAADLTAGDPPTVRKRGEEDCVDVRQLTQSVKHLVRAFVNERHCADLNSDRSLIGNVDSWRRGKGDGIVATSEQGRSRNQRRGFEKRTTIHLHLLLVRSIDFSL